MSNWQPIEIAPEGKWALYAYSDGSIVKAQMTTCWASAHKHEPGGIKRHIVDGSGDGEWCHPELTDEPTHWMPLPKPPKP